MARWFSFNRRRTGLILVSTLAASAALLPSAARATDFRATPSSFASMFSQAQGGATVYLSSQSYGSWSRSANSAMVVLVEDAGASPSMSDGIFGSGVLN